MERSSRGLWVGHKVAAESLLDNRLSPHNGIWFQFQRGIITDNGKYNLLTIFNEKK